MGHQVSRADRWIRWATTASVLGLAGIAAVVSYRHMHALAVRHGESVWTAALVPLSVDGMIVASSMTLLLDSRHGSRGGVLPWTLLLLGSGASLAANVAVAEPSLVDRVSAAWPSLALIGAYELLMRQIRHAAGRPEMVEAAASVDGHMMGTVADAVDVTLDVATEPEEHDVSAAAEHTAGLRAHNAARSREGRLLQRTAWQWAQRQRLSTGALPTGRAIAARFGRHERWGRLVKNAGTAGDL